MSRRFIKVIGLIIIVMMVFSCGKKMTEREIFDEAQKLQSESNFEKSAELYQKLLKDYPESRYYASALFMLGFLYANDIKDIDKASTYYNEFLKKFPDHELTDDVEFELKNLGKPITDIDKVIQDNIKKKEKEDK